MANDKPRALVLAPMRGPGMDLLNDLADVVYDPWIEHRPLQLHKPEDLAKRLAEESATILVCEGDKCAGPVLEQPLTVIGSTRGDPTNVDLPAATAAGIPVLKAPGRNADGVAELTIALMFAVNRHLLVADREVRTGEMYKDGTIPYQRHRAWQLAGQTLGIVGYGAIGRAVAWRAKGLGMEVLAYDPFADDATSSLEELLAGSDVVTMHAPVLDSTRGMIGEAQFAAMKDGAVYLNAARAYLHDTDALVAALQSGKLAGAGLDHFENEHLAPDHPLASMDQVVLAPHIGGATYDTEANHSLLIAEDIQRVLAGERPLRIANPEVYS